MTSELVILTAGAALGAALYSGRTGTPRAKAVTVVCAMTAIVVAVAHAAWRDTPSAMRAQLERMELAYTGVSTQMLGHHLAAEHPGAKVMVIYPMAHLRDPGRFEALMTGLERGLGEQAAILVRHDPELPKAYHVADFARDKEAFEEIDVNSWFNAAYFDRMIEAHGKNCDVVISLAGLPDDYANMRFWNKPGRPRMALAYYGAPGLRHAVREGFIDAAVVMRQEPVFDGRMPPEDLDEAFSRRYHLMTQSWLEERRDRRLEQRKTKGPEAEAVASP